MPESVYRPRHPQESAYYQCVEDYVDIFEQVYEERFERRYFLYDRKLLSGLSRRDPVRMITSGTLIIPPKPVSDHNMLPADRYGMLKFPFFSRFR